MDARCAILLILLAASCGVVGAQTHSVADGSKSGNRTQNRLLVLTDGQIVSGDITPRPDGYDIKLPAGRMFINSDRVRFTASSLPDAYELMRDSMPEFTPTSHLELARWCLNNKLHSQARREVLDALFLDPNRDDAKRMLQALEKTGQAATPHVREDSGLTEYPSQTKIQRTVIETRSLAGLNRSVVHSFVGSVQKLLTNKCATSGCHGPGTSSQFELISTHKTSTPAISERNLAAILKQIDFSNPAASRLLAMGEQAHGNMNSSAFHGRSGALQIKILRDWVQQVANDIAPEASTAAARLEDTASQKPLPVIQKASATGETRDPIALLQTPEEMSGVPNARQLTTDDTDKRFLAEARHANRRDPFSPDEFNRRFHRHNADTSADQSVRVPKSTSKSVNNSDAQVP